VTVLRGDEIIYPRGDTKILDSDKVLIITNNTVLSTLLNDLYGGGNKKWKLRKTKLKALHLN